MDKKLVARIQKLSKKLPQMAQEFSSIISIEPDEEDLVEKKGQVYSAFDFRSETNIDPLLVAKIVHDVMYDSYYGSESSSPIQSLERAIVEVKEKVMSLQESVADFNLLAVVFWGNVLYMVQFGRGGSFLVRDGVVKPVNSATEGSFSVASGVVKDGDVVILGTASFINAYTPEDLISGNISFSMHDLDDTAAALLLKFDLVDEAPKFQPEAENQLVGEPTLELAKKMPNELPKIKLTRAQKKTNPPLIVGGIAVLLLMVSIAFSLRGKKSESLPSDAPEVESAQNQSPVIDTSDDATLKIERVDPAVFYDIKLVDSNANPTDITVLDSEVVVSDQNSGKLFSSSLTTSKFEEAGTFAGIRNIGYFGGDLVFTDNEGYKVWDGTAVTESYAGTVSGSAAPYLAYLYEAGNGKVTKYSLTDAGLEGVEWAASSDFDSPKSLAVDGNIYVLSSGSLVKWYAGEKATFEIKGLDKPLSNAAKIVKTVDLTNIYVADSANQRVLILDAEGNLVKQILAHNEKFNDIKSIGVSPTEDKIFVLSGSKVYGIDL